MARVNVPKDSELSEAVRQQVSEAEKDGKPATVLRVLGLRPEMTEAYFKFYYPLHLKGVVEPQLKELVRLKIAGLNQCLT